MLRYLSYGMHVIRGSSGKGDEMHEPIITRKANQHDNKGNAGTEMIACQGDGVNL